MITNDNRWKQPVITNGNREVGVGELPQRRLRAAASIRAAAAVTAESISRLVEMFFMCVQY